MRLVNYIPDMENEIINRMGFMMEQALGTMTGALANAFKANGIDLPHSQYTVLRLLYSSVLYDTNKYC